MSHSEMDSKSILDGAHNDLVVRAHALRRVILRQGEIMREMAQASLPSKAPDFAHVGVKVTMAHCTRRTSLSDPNANMRWARVAVSAPFGHDTVLFWRDYWTEELVAKVTELESAWRSLEFARLTLHCARQGRPIPSPRSVEDAPLVLSW